MSTADNAGATAPEAPSTEELYRRLGELTRSLHEALQGLGHDRRIEAAVSSLPEARSRLSYISQLTGDAAERVLNAVDLAKADQTELLTIAAAAREAVASSGAPGDAAVNTLIDEVLSRCARTDDHLTDIMMAQDFHDLTGQVSNKLVTMVEKLEHDLVQLLVAAAPPAVNEDSLPALSGPIIDKTRSDVVTGQAAVDDLLDSLGF